jgi:hypothetical protein
VRRVRATWRRVLAAPAWLDRPDALRQIYAFTGQERLEHALHLARAADQLRDIAQLPGGHRLPPCGGGRGAVESVEQAADFGHCETRALGEVDESQDDQHVGVVDAASRHAPRWSEETHALVVAEGRGSNLCLAGNGADGEPGAGGCDFGYGVRLDLKCALRVNVQACPALPRWWVQRGRPDIS